MARNICGCDRVAHRLIAVLGFWFLCGFGSDVLGAELARLLTLDEAGRLALRNNPTIEIMQARADQGAAEVKRAWAQLKPTATVSGTYTYNDPQVVVDFSALTPVGQTPPPPSIIVRHHQYGYSVQAGLPLFRGAAYQDVGVAKKGFAAAGLRLVRSREDYLLRVADAYYAALGAGEVVSALEEKVNVDRKNLDVAQAQLAVGRTLRSDAARAELILVQDEQALRQQRNLWDAAKKRVAILVGVGDNIELRRPGEPKASHEDPQMLVHSALEHRVDIQALNVDIAAAEQAKRSVWWSFFPTLDVGVLYRWQNVEGFANRKDTLAVMVTLALQIYDGGLRYANLRRAQARITEAAATRAQLARDIAEAIVQQRADMLSAEAGVVSAEKAVGLAILSAEEMLARYEAGTATQLDLLDVTQRRLQARIDLTRNLYTRDMARLALAHTLGELRPSLPQ